MKTDAVMGDPGLEMTDRRIAGLVWVTIVAVCLALALPRFAHADEPESRWRAKPEGFYCSPVLVGDHVYIVDKEGRTFIFEAASEYKLLASPELKEMVSCTPAYVEGRIYIRGDKHLFCIGEK